MKQFNYIEAFGPEKGVATILLNRPEVHNAFNIEMIRELQIAYADFNLDDQVRIIILKARGKNFSAGADLKWMQEGVNQSEEQLRKESEELAQLFKTIYESDKVTVALVEGKVIGGANGLLAATDIVIATPKSSFTFSEAKIGLIPATIAPYIIRKTGTSAAREWFLTSRTISGKEAYYRGLVQWITDKIETERKSDELCKMILGNGPQALRSIKEMLREMAAWGSPDSTLEKTVELLVETRVSSEAQEGIMSFLEKRNPNWANEL